MRKQSFEPKIKLLEEMAIFAIVADTKSFTKTANLTGLSKAAISKCIARLETHLGAKLLNRTTRNMSLTEAGLVLYSHCSRIQEEAESAQEAVMQLYTEPTGTLRVSTSVAFGLQHIIPASSLFLQKYPNISLQVGLSDNFIDITQEGFDVLIRLTNEPPHNLAARKLATFTYVLCASPAYLAKHGSPKTPDDLPNHNCLFYSYMKSTDKWILDGPNGTTEVFVASNMVANSSDAVRTSARNSIGIALLPTYAISEDINTGTLRIVLPNHTPRGLFGNSVYALYSPTRHIPPKIRVFIDFFIQRFNQMPNWNPAR